MPKSARTAFIILASEKILLKKATARLKIWLRGTLRRRARVNKVSASNRTKQYKIELFQKVIVQPHIVVKGHPINNDYSISAMASFSSKSLPHSIKSLQRPVVWVPFSVSFLLCLALWQYYRPSSQADALFGNDSSEADSSAQLKPDNLRQLLESSRGASLTGRTNPTTIQEIDSTLPSDLKLIQPASQSNTGQLDQNSSSVDTAAAASDPFANYRDEYQFSSGSSAALETTAGSVVLNEGATPSKFNFETAPRTGSALFETLRRQAEAREKTREETREETLEQAAQPPNSPQPIPNTTAPNQSGSLQTSPPPGAIRYQTAPAQLPSRPSLTNLQISQPPSPAASTLSPASAPTPNAPSVLYTPPTFRQPDQGRPIDPRQ